MHNSVAYWLTAAYRSNEPVLAQDETPAETLRKAVRRLTRRWQKRFNALSDDLASYFAKSVQERTSSALKAALKKGGFTVEFKMTAAQRDVLNAVTHENAALIKSISQQYLGKVEGLVMRSVSTGRDLGQLTKDLTEQFGVTRRRAAFIAHTQNNLATAVMTAARQREIGVTEAVWVHSGGGRHPRKSHLKAGRDRQTYDPAKGWLDPEVGEYILPGQLPNCFPGDMPVSLSGNPVRVWRAPFNGPMVHLEIGPDLLKGTPNHPILTARGWVGIGELDCGDQVVCVALQNRDVIHHDENERVTTFAELFEAWSGPFGYVSRKGAGFNFYGDRPNGNVDEVVVGYDNLLNDRQPSIGEDSGNLAFAEADRSVVRRHLGGDTHIPAADFASPADDTGPPFGASGGEPGSVRVAAGAHHASARKDISDVGRGMPRGADFGSYRRGPEAGLVQGYDFGGERFPISTPIGGDPEQTKLFAQFVRSASDSGRRIFEFESTLYEFRCVTDKRIRDFSGHVFTMQTLSGYYSVGSAFVQAKNCRCVSRAVVKGFG